MKIILPRRELSIVGNHLEGRDISLRRLFVYEALRSPCIFYVAVINAQSSKSGETTLEGSNIYEINNLVVLSTKALSTYSTTMGVH